MLTSRLPRFTTDSGAIAEALQAALARRANESEPARVERVERPSSALSAGDTLQVVFTTSDWLGRGALLQPLYILDERGNLAEQLSRLVEVVRLSKRITPQREEAAMHAALSAALRSGACRGGVGSALTDVQGDIVALGTAEVPAYGGGQYWEGATNDARDLHPSRDPATAARSETVEVLLRLLASKGVALPSEPHGLASDLLREFDQQQLSFGVGHGGSAAQTFESLGRVVHAEMAALSTAARNGLRTTGLTLHTTALPCRQCLRHLVCAGLERVVYLGQRLHAAPPFHADSVTVAPGDAGKLELVPFTGVGPGLYQNLFGAQSTHLRQ
jgi:cytidine deaminase